MQYAELLHGLDEHEEYDMGSAIEAESEPAADGRPHEGKDRMQI